MELLTLYGENRTFLRNVGSYSLMDALVHHWKSESAYIDLLFPTCFFKATSWYSMANRNIMPAIEKGIKLDRSHSFTWYWSWIKYAIHTFLSKTCSVIGFILEKGWSGFLANKPKWMKFGNTKNDQYMGFVHRLMFKDWWSTTFCGQDRSPPSGRKRKLIPTRLGSIRKAVLNLTTIRVVV
jgi:hypothetical protein